MCFILRETNKKGAKGWKIVYIDKEGRYRSIVTGYLYREGQRARKSRVRYINIIKTKLDVKLKDMIHFPSMEGRTGVFKTKENARRFLCSILKVNCKDSWINKIAPSIKIVKAKVTGQIADGSAYYSPSSGGPVWLGEKIWFKNI